MTDPENDSNIITTVDPGVSLQAATNRDIALRGKTAVADIGAKNRQLANLKPGSETIRTPAMIDEIVYRLLGGESLLSICTDPQMPAYATVALWMRNDLDLRSLIGWARVEGTHVLFDAMQDIAQRGYFSTGDVERDAMLIKVLQIMAAKRNRTDFGDAKVEVTKNTINYVVTKSDADW